MSVTLLSLNLCLNKVVFEAPSDFKPILQLQLGRNKTLSVSTLPSSAIRTVLAAPHLLHVHAEYNNEAVWRLKHSGARKE